MAMRPKTRHRLMILSIICLVVGAGGFTWWKWTERNLHIALDRMRQDGIAAFEARDWTTAINKLGNYVSHDEVSHGEQYNEALLALAHASEYIADANPTQPNNDAAIERWQKYIEVAPDSVEAQHSLLKLDQDAGRIDEAMQLASQLLAANPNDPAALEAVAMTKFQAGNATAALDPARKYNRLSPLDLHGWALTFSIERQLSTSLTRMMADVLAQEAKSNDPRLKLAEVLAYRDGFDSGTSEDDRQKFYEKEKALLITLTSPPIDPPDVEYVTYAVSSLDAFNLYTNSEEFLRRAAKTIHDPLVRQQYVQRLWQNGENAEVVKELADVTPQSTGADPALLAYKALALHALGNDADANALVDALGARTDDSTAMAWSLGLRANFRPQSDDSGQSFKDYETAITNDPRNGVLRLMIAQAYYGAHENDLALEEAERAALLLPSWRRARVLEVQAQLGLNQDRTDAQFAVAPTLSDEAAVAGDSVVTQYYWQFENDRYRNDRAGMQSLLAGMETFRQDHPGDVLLERLYVEALATLGEPEKARAAIRQIIADPPPQAGDALSQRGGEALMLSLVIASAESSLGMEDQILTVAEQKFGLSPRVAFSRAQFEVRAKKWDVAAAVKYLKEASAKGNGAAWQWGMVDAQFRDLYQDSGARDAWVALGNGYPKNLSVQSAILNLRIAPSVWKTAKSDPTFLNTTVDRLHALTGDQALAWRLAKARLLLSSDQKQDASQAILLLTDILKHPEVESRESEPHRLKADALQQVGDMEGAVAEIKRASNLAPTNVLVAFEALVLCHQAGHVSDARDAFDHLRGLAAAVPESMAEQAALIMFDEHEFDRAADILSYCVAAPDAPHSAVGLLARVYVQMGRIKDAGELYLKLKDAADLQANVIEPAADFFADYGQMDTARHFLAMLDHCPAPAEQKEMILARFEEQFGQAGNADEMYKQAIAADKNNPSPVAYYVGYLIRQEQFDVAIKTADAGLASWPDNQDLVALKMLAQAMASAPYANRLAPVVAEMTADLGDRAKKVIAALTAMAEAQAMSDADAVKRMQQALKDNIDYYPIHELTVSRMLMSPDADIKSAAMNLAQATMDQFPDLPAAAKLAANAYAENGDWSTALRVAQQWRQRSTHQPEEADFYVARCQLNLGDSHSAADRLQVYIPDAQAKPNDPNNAKILRLYAQALLLSGRVDDADAILRPLAKGSSNWRATWLDLARDSFLKGEDAAAWIERVKPLLAPGDQGELRTLANAWFNVATQLSYTHGMELCRDILRPMADKGELDQTSLLTLAAAENQLNDPNAAQDYQRVVDADGGKHTRETAIAQNNLANLLLQKGDPASLTEAEPLALAAATSTDPSLSDSRPYFFDTLARIYLKEGRIDDAVLQFRKANDLLPYDPIIMIGLADAQVQDKKLDRALETVQLLDQHMDPSTRLAPEYQQELDTVRAALRPATRRSVTNIDTGN